MNKVPAVGLVFCFFGAVRDAENIFSLFITSRKCFVKQKTNITYHQHPWRIKLKGKKFPRTYFVYLTEFRHFDVGGGKNNSEGIFSTNLFLKTNFRVLMKSEFIFSFLFDAIILN